ncbi:MAG: peptidoglycan DD-metalloendopeptidase family protein [Gammaproteobacteria bacterium]|jgi:murein DD-endopeptidase MepM/ murein hydrolase activator NlpD|nr:peptidoglycan DD-metalloendopeptidase family protein [Gammaproteobacteria bacterium]
MLTGMAVAFGTSSTTITYQGTFEDLVETVSVPTARRIAPDIQGIARETRIERGDTVFSLLAKLDVHDESLRAFLYTDNKADLIFRQLAPGKSISAEVLPDGELLSLAFPLNGNNESALNVTRTGSGFVTRIDPLPLDARIVAQSATIHYSLFGAADEAGIPDDVAIGLADIFGGEIDFHRDLRKGDNFTVIYEQDELSGKSIRTKRILAAEFINDGKTHQAFWYQHDDGKGGYYTADGSSLRKAFLRSPLEFSRITSGFSKARYHPVLREVRAHRGIDYAAPTGTRVRATGDGIISFAGTQGGYGKVIAVRHKGNKVTVYGHLSGFASGIKTGKRVSQGETIGYVGATGLATGPHLHYEFRVDGVHRNPLTVAIPPATPLPTTVLSKFRSVANGYLSQMTLTKGWQLAKLD